VIAISKALHPGRHRAKGQEKLKYYPIFLDIRNKKCVVVGGGEVAARKVSRLLECGAKVFVISPELSPELVTLKENNAICHIASSYTGAFPEGARLVIGATDDEATNKWISSDARKKGILVNIVDDPEKCDFIVPSLVRRGELAVAVGTGGKSPALARHLREELEKQYGNEYEILLNILGRLRAKMEKNAGVGAEWFKALMNAGILAAIKEKDDEKVRQIVKKITGEDLEIDV
jgi:precorrin-2 dehydrogenase/sirohydrochlorin ferrochelatase